MTSHTWLFGVAPAQDSKPSERGGREPFCASTPTGKALHAFIGHDLLKQEGATLKFDNVHTAGWLGKDGRGRDNEPDVADGLIRMRQWFDEASKADGFVKIGLFGVTFYRRVLSQLFRDNTTGFHVRPHEIPKHKRVTVMFGGSGRSCNEMAIWVFDHPSNWLKPYENEPAADYRTRLSVERDNEHCQYSTLHVSLTQMLGHVHPRVA